ncbi:RAM signaling network component [Rhizophlyctis rosea]|uniref:RAM signaling network component n=1 Tax=Rhizophlyctis rosea TaxID=64517 RepID=A0AAD5SCA3_9FUNG|nr:RAM signaling network component [Rhizophlyctis rosea]
MARPPPGGVLPYKIHVANGPDPFYSNRPPPPQHAGSYMDSYSSHRRQPSRGEVLPTVSQAADNENLGNVIREEHAKGAVSLNLGDRKLEHLPPEIGLLLELERLGLPNNLLTTLPTEIGKLAHLRYLNLKSNLLREFPAVLCDLPRLEVLDISRNKIKRLPSALGNLMNLKVLSIARNRIQQIPSYIGYMSELQVLKLEHNPIQWPPPDVVQCHSEEEHERERWLKSFKEYLVRHPNNAGHNFTGGNEEAAGGASGVRGWLTRYLNFQNERNQPCDVLVETYLREAKPLTGVNSGSEQDVRVVDVARGVASALAGIYKTGMRLVGASDNKAVAAVLERDLTDLNGKISKLVSVLKAVDDAMQGQNGEGGGGILNSHRANQSVEQRAAEVKRVVLASTGEARRTVGSVQEHMKPLLQGVDMRVARTALVDWYGANAELATTFQNLHPQPTSIATAAQMGYTPRDMMNGMTSPAGGNMFFMNSHNRRPSDSAVDQYVVDVETVLALARAAVNAAIHSLRILYDIPGSLNAGLIDADVPALLDRANEATNRMVETLEIAQGEREDTTHRKNFYEDASLFIQAVVKLTNGIKTVATTQPFDAETTASVSNLTRTTKELMIALATHGNQALGASGSSGHRQQVLQRGLSHRRIGSGRGGGHGGHGAQSSFG